MRVAAAVLAVSLLPAAYVAWTLRDHPHLGHAHDDGLYAVAAKSLSEGRGYRLLSLPGEPYQTKYPPLMPLLIAALMPLAPQFPRELTAITLGIWLFLPLLTLTFFAFLLRAGTPRWGAAAAAAVVALSPQVAYFSSTLLSDVACAALVVCTMWLTQRAADPAASSGRAAAAGIAGALAILMRTAALPVLAGPLWLAARGRRRPAVVCAAVMLAPVAGWTWWARQHTPASGDPVDLYYLNYLGWYFYDLRPSDWWLFVSQNSERILTAMTTLLGASLPHPSLDLVLGALLCAGAVSGAWRWARARGTSPYHYFAIGYLPVVLIWHYRPDPRFVLPLFPFYVAALGWELGPLVQGIAGRWRTADRRERAAAVVLGGVLAALGAWIVLNATLGFGAQIPAEIASRRQLRASLDQGFAWIEHNTPRDATVLSFADPAVYLFTGRHGIQQPRSPKPFFRNDRAAQLEQFREWPAFCRRYGLDYLVLTTAEMERAMSPEEYQAFRLQVLESGGFELMFQAPGIEIYRPVKPATVPVRKTN